MNGLLNPLTAMVRHLLPALLIGFFLAGCGSSDRSNPAGPDEPRLKENRDFYGAYQLSWTIGDCENEIVSLMIGDDANLADDRQYIYLSAPGDASEEALGITRQENEIILTRNTADHQTTIRLDFSKDLTSATVSGSMDGIGDCSGEISGNLTLITRTPAEIGGEYLQFRHYPDVTGNGQSAWLGLRQNGQPLDAENIIGARLYQITGDEAVQVGGALSVETYSSRSLYCGLFNPETGTVDLDDSRQTVSGMSLSLDPGLPAGPYRFEASITENDMIYVVKKSVYYPGDELSPLICDIRSEYNDEGDLVISWEPLADDDPEQELRIHLGETDHKGLWRDLLSITVASDDQTQSLTLGADWMALLDNMVADSADEGVLAVQIQTRTYSEDGMNVARGYSSVPVDNRPFYGAYTVTVEGEEVCSEAMSITIGNDADRACLSDYIYLPEQDRVTSWACGTVTRQGRNLIVEGADEGSTMMFRFNETLTLAGLSGTKTQGLCTGDVTGTATLITREPMTLEFGEICAVYKADGYMETQVRVALVQNGVPVEADSLQNIRIINSLGDTLALVDASDSGVFTRRAGLFGLYNPVDQTVDNLDTMAWSGLTIREHTVPADRYSVYVTSRAGYTVSTRIDYPGPVPAIPVVSRDSMTFEEGVEGTMRLAWSLPAETCDRYLVRIIKADFSIDQIEEILTIQVDPDDGTEEILLSSDLVDTVKTRAGILQSAESLYMEIQAQHLTDSGMVYTQGKSLPVLLVPPE